MSFYVDVKKGKFKAAMKALSEPAQNAIEQALLSGGRMVADDAKKLAPAGKIPNNISYILQNSGTKEAVVKVGLPKKIFWGHFVEFGTSGHEIEPVKKSALSWAPRIGKFEFANKKGKTVKKTAYRKADGTYTLDKGEARITVKSVEHPGGPAKPFLFPAYNQNKPKVKEKLADAIIKVMKNAQGAGGSD